MLPLGNYQVTAEAAGFQPGKQKVTVVTSQTTAVNLILGVAGSEVMVEVDTGQGGEAAINSDSPTTGTSITGRALEQAPLVNRTPFGRLQTDTGVSGDIANPLTNGNGNPEILGLTLPAYHVRAPSSTESTRPTSRVRVALLKASRPLLRPFKKLSCCRASTTLHWEGTAVEAFRL